MKVDGYPGIDFQVQGYPKVWQPLIATIENIRGDMVAIDTGEGRWVEDPTSDLLIVTMLGDDCSQAVAVDAVFTEDLELISDPSEEPTEVFVLNPYCQGAVGCDS